MSIVVKDKEVMSLRGSKGGIGGVERSRGNREVIQIHFN